MSMSTVVQGIKLPDEKWKKMKAAWDACEKAGIDIPREVEEYFGGEKPDSKGVVVYLEDHGCCSVFVDEGRDGFEIDLKKLPKDVSIIRFYNSW